MRPLIYIGQVSYGIYLFHPLVIVTVRKHFGDQSLATDLAAVALSVLAGMVSWQFIEKPLGNLKRWFSYRSSDPVSQNLGSESSTPHSPSPIFPRLPVENP